MAQDLFPPASPSGGLTDAELRASDVPVSLASAPLPLGAATDTVVGTLLTAGTDISGASMPSGGSGGMGWLSAIWKAFTDRIPASLVSGRLDVNVGNTPAVTFSGDVTVVGKAAENAAASGNPLLLGARYSFTTPTAVDHGDAVPLWCDSTGQLHVAVMNVPAVTVSGIPAVAARGADAHDAGASANPVLLAGYASASAPSAVSADGDVVRLWSDRNGRLQVGDGGGSLTVDNGGTFAVQADTELPTAAALSDATANPTAPMVGSAGMYWDGSQWVREQGKETGTLLASAAYTATQSGSGSPVVSRTAKGVIVYVYVSAVGTGTLTLNLCEVDPVFGQGLVVAAATVTASIGAYRASWYPGASGTGLGVILTASHPLARSWYIVLSKSDSSSWTFGASYTLVP